VSPETAKWDSLDLPPPRATGPEKPSNRDPAGEPAKAAAADPASSPQNGQAGWSSDTDARLAARMSPVAWTSDHQASSTNHVSLDLADVGQDRKEQPSAEGGGARSIDIGGAERPPAEAPVAAARSEPGGEEEEASPQGDLKAPDPMRAAFISDDAEPGRDRAGRKGAAGGEQLALAADPRQRRRSLTLEENPEPELPAPMRAVAAQLSFIKPGMGDVLGGLAIIALGLWVGGSVLLGRPGATDVMFDAAGIGWFLVGVYRLTGGSRSR
jgi:hypothetical protein